MADIDFKAIKRANVYLREQHAGILEKQGEGEYSFQYITTYVRSPDSLDIARSLPRRMEPYLSRTLHPFFDNMISEGWLLQHAEKIFHIDKSNRFALLMATGKAPIGAVTIRPVNPDDREIDITWEYKEELLSEQLRQYPALELEEFPYCPTCFKAMEEGKQHRKCTLEMWGTEKQLKLEMDGINPLQSFMRVIYGGSISGAQKKGMFRLDKKKGLLIPTPASANYILKPDGEFPDLPTNEHVTMAIAKRLNFKVPPFTLLKVEKLGYVFAIKRFDRSKEDLPLMSEDMGQIIKMPSTDKYESSYERIANAIKSHSSAPKVDLLDFFRRIVFCFISANADMHLKNWTMVENPKALGTFMLSPCYDLLNTRIPIPREKIDLGLKMLGKDRNLQKSYFKKFGLSIGLTAAKIENIFAELPDWRTAIDDLVDKSLMPAESKLRYMEIAEERTKLLI